jgi:GT2 family glycosyltransferase
LGNLALLDHGSRYLELKEFKGNFIYGANMAFRKEALETLGLFSTELGRKGDNLLSGEDTEIQRRLFNAGRKILYTPESAVHHKIPRERMAFSYFVKWNYEYGKTVALMTPPKARLVPFWLVRQCAVNRLKALYARLRKQTPLAVRYELNYWFQRGQLSGFFKDMSLRGSRRLTKQSSVNLDCHAPFGRSQ